MMIMHCTFKALFLFLNKEQQQNNENNTIQQEVVSADLRVLVGVR